MPYYLKHLTLEDRSVWGTCPVCYAEPGTNCRPACPSEGPCDICGSPNHGPCLLGEMTGAHIARLINAPMVAAVDEGVRKNNEQIAL